jgi:hypothetical protein
METNCILPSTLPMWGLKVEPDDHNRYSITYPYK